MAMCRGVCLFQSCKILRLSLSTSSAVSNKWRIEQGLESEPRQYGPLTNLPDYSFVDGRPVQLSRTKYKKIKFQEELCKKIVNLSHELDVGLAQYHQNQEKIKLEKENILNNKLKPKGAALLTQNKKAQS